MNSADRLATNRVARFLRSQAKKVDDLDRRLSSVVMTGRVAEVDGDRIRIDLATEGAQRPFLSPWVQLQEMAGSTGSRFPVAVGDPMRLLSPHGEIGPQSLAIRDGYTQDKTSPAEGDELAIAHGGCVIRMAGGVIRLEGDLKFEGNGVSHNGKNIGHDHVHRDVEPGPGMTGAPA